MIKLDKFNIERLDIDARALRDLKKATRSALLEGAGSVNFNGSWVLVEIAQELITKLEET
jgi:hypothetical protein